MVGGFVAVALTRYSYGPSSSAHLTFHSRAGPSTQAPSHPVRPLNSARRALKKKPSRTVPRQAVRDLCLSQVFPIMLLARGACLSWFSHPYMHRSPISSTSRLCQSATAWPACILDARMLPSRYLLTTWVPLYASWRDVGSWGISLTLTTLLFFILPTLPVSMMESAHQFVHSIPFHSFSGD